jgi:PAS domain S-box-containing protein
LARLCIGGAVVDLEAFCSSWLPKAPMSPTVVGRQEVGVSTRAGLPAVQQVRRLLAGGAEPGRVATQVVHAAIAGSAAVDGVLLAAGHERLRVLAATGSPSKALRTAAEAAMAEGRPARRAEDGSARSVLAVPIRAGGRVLGALGVSADLRTLDHTQLSLLADAAAVLLAARPSPSPMASELLDAVGRSADAPDAAAALATALATAGPLFGAARGCTVATDGDRLRITALTGLDRTRLVAACEDREFLRAVTSSHAVVGRGGSRVARLLGDGGDALVALPMGGTTPVTAHLVLLLPRTPDDERLLLLAAFARAVGGILAAPELRRRVRTGDQVLAAAAGAVAAPLLVAAEGKFVLVNPAAAALFGLSAGFDVGQPVAGRLGNPRVEEMLCGRSEGGEVALTEPGGRERVFRASVSAATGANGRTLGTAVVLDDITSRNELERIKADLVAVIGHELRTPITIVKSAVRTLTRRGGDMDPETRTSTFDAVGRNVERLERLVEDLLFVASVNDGPTALRRQKVDVGELVAAEAGERVRVERPRHPVELDIDADKVRHAVRHLVDNALKHSQHEVVVEVLERDDVVEIAVTDAGVGIFSGDIPTLFRRFRQLDGSSTRATGGTGLGLYVARRIVEGHGGRIWCQSRLGHGSRFAFALPR